MNLQVPNLFGVDMVTSVRRAAPWPPDMELCQRAADHMLLLWAITKGRIVIDFLTAELRYNGLRWSLSLDAFGCPILPQDLRDKLRELYIAAAKEG